MHFPKRDPVLSKQIFSAESPLKQRVIPSKRMKNDVINVLTSAYAHDSSSSSSIDEVDDIRPKALTVPAKRTYKDQEDKETS